MTCLHAKHGKPFTCVERIGKFLRELKYSNTPPECSINIFELNLEDLSNEAREIFNVLKQYSYLIKTKSRRGKNTNDKYGTYYINGIIAPYWELSLNKRGVVKLTEEEAENIFNQVLKLYPDDGPALLYLERCRQYQDYEPDNNWDGVYTFSEK